MGAAAVAKKGDVDVAMASSEQTLEGELYSGGQEHMYLEPHSVVVVPGECDELTVIAATQAPGMLQDTIGKIVNRKRNQIQVIVKRVGTYVCI